MNNIEKSIPKSMVDLINHVKGKFEDPKVVKMFENGICNTYLTTLKSQPDGTTFVITGDIPAMWNRDSAAQVKPLLRLVNESTEIKSLVRGVIESHKRQIIYDPYANAHNLNPCVGEHAKSDIPKNKELVWERKYELDSLCYPIDLAITYAEQSLDESIYDDQFLMMTETIVEVITLEQKHENSDYKFQRTADWLLFGEPERIPFETLPNEGHGRKVGYTGMSWCGFRPSDDACQYGYHIPSNMYAVVCLRRLAKVININYDNRLLSIVIDNLANEIDAGIKEYGIIQHEKYGAMYAYEVDGLGNYYLMDDANVPSLLSAPYLGYCEIDDEVYQNTRRFILSKDNPYYFEGEEFKGVGSSHTPIDYFWHIALAIEGLTTIDENERKRILKQFIMTDGNTNMMHEGINVNDPNKYTREWFSWANSMFAEFILDYCNM